MYRDNHAEFAARLKRGDRHPIRNGSWAGYRREFDLWRNWEAPTTCQWCEGALDTFDHEELWDNIRKVVWPTGKWGYSTMPGWFPSTVCSDCAAYLTPFVQTITDIKLLELYSNKLGEVICNVRKSESRRAEVHWSAPVPISQCSEVCD